ncbi:hypothetical protein R3P38DRAFT_2567174 [Favolaschia claudopus]|uniref:Uncharacterized protein n=1 Tax=Favolaschia claudopus TaxID=2862362 RepID=A0AAV9ZX38_9AGAR
MSDSGSAADSLGSVEFEPVKGKQTVSNEDKASLRSELIAWRKDRHFRNGNSPYIPCEVLLPPKQLEKIVSSAATFLGKSIVEPRHVLKVVPWDMAPAADVSEVCDVISRWRLTLDIVRTPPSARRARKQARAHGPPPAPPPIFSLLTPAHSSPSTPRGRGGSLRGARGTSRRTNSIRPPTFLTQTPLPSAQHTSNPFPTPTYDDFFSGIASSHPPRLDFLFHLPSRRPLSLVPHSKK